MIKQFNDRQEVKLNMYRATEQHVDANIGVISPIPAFQATYTKIKSNIADILAVAGQKIPLTGHAEAKKAAKKDLSKLTATIAGVVSSYAAASGDKPLQHEMDVEVSILERTRDDALIPQVQLIHDRAATHLVALADYNLTAADLTDFQTAIDDYAAISQTPRAAVSGRATANSNLADLFAETDDLFEKQFDKQIESLRENHPDFVNTYFSTREIIDVAAKSEAGKNQPPETPGDAPL